MFVLQMDMLMEIILKLLEFLTGQHNIADITRMQSMTQCALLNDVSV